METWEQELQEQLDQDEVDAIDRMMAKAAHRDVRVERRATDRKARQQVKTIQVVYDD